MLQIVSCKPSEEFDMAGGSLQTRDLSGCAGFRHQTFALSCIRADNQSLSQKWSGIKRKIRDTFKSSSLLLLRFAFHSGFLLRHHLAFYHDPSPSFLLKIWSSGSQSTQFLARPRGASPALFALSPEMASLFIHLWLWGTARLSVVTDWPGFRAILLNLCMNSLSSF